MEECSTCGGAGSGYYDYEAWDWVSGTCPDCYGLGEVPTELGKQVVMLLEWKKLEDESTNKNPIGS